MKMRGKQIVLLFTAFMSLTVSGYGIGGPRYVESTPHPDSFTIVQGQQTAEIAIDPADHPGVIRAAADLQTDITHVTGKQPGILNRIEGSHRNVIVIGTIGKSPLIDRLVASQKLDVSEIQGKWESFLLQVVPAPFPGVETALVIAGSDKRGTIYGIYDLSEQMGVSPWYWWADVPVSHKDAVFVKAGKYVSGEPAVKYRGIFLNDEAPSLTGWVKEKYGNYNHQFYTKVFELLLRLKANYLWPAMWDNAFNEDDPLNPKLADEYGIVMGTSHHEPMLRAQQEWKRHGSGPWDYSKNADVLRNFWDEGIQRNKAYESIITVGMRGDGDMPMSESANIQLLEGIVADQRKILAQRMTPDLASVPQDWALYKEVQEYYEKGMRVPDDVTLLWCDDNWGNVRRLPTPEERKRSGGAGIYYHFDYVGGPRSYKWLNTIPITKIWEQMNLAYNYDARRIWIVNVGDLKPMEFPIDFFLTFARYPKQWPKERISEFTQLWAEREFGPAHAAEIADIISRYTKYNGRRKPELLAPDTFSLTDYNEAERVTMEWDAIVQKAEDLYRKVPENQRAAFFELVLYPVKASAIVTKLYIAAGKNHLYASQGRAAANTMAAQVRRLFQADAQLSFDYNHQSAGHGKWNHMMDQTHIGYTGWNQPPENVAPAVSELKIPEAAEMGVGIEGSASAWPGAEGEPVLPDFDALNRQSRYIEVFNRGKAAFDFTASTSAPWIRLSTSRGTVREQTRILVSIDWSRMPGTDASGWVKTKRIGGQETIIRVRGLKPQVPRFEASGFVEANGYVSIEAEHYSRNVPSGTARWEQVVDYGRTLGSMTIFPTAIASIERPVDAPRLEYDMSLSHSGKITVEAIVAPTLNFVPGRGLRFAVAFDDQPPQVIDALADNSLHAWEESVKDSVRTVRSVHTLATPGRHTLKIWMVDPGVVLQKLVVDTGGVKPSYLGPPESYRVLTAGGSAAGQAVR